MAGTTNGVVYCNGNIGAQGDPKTGGLHGQIADNQLDNSGNLTHNNALTIATPITDNCNLDGSIKYSTSRQIAKDASGNPEYYVDVNGQSAPTIPPKARRPSSRNKTRTPTSPARPGQFGIISNNALVTRVGLDGQCPEQV